MPAYSASDDKDRPIGTMDHRAVAGHVARSVANGVQRSLGNVEPCPVAVTLVVVLGHGAEVELRSPSHDVELAATTAQDGAVAGGGGRGSVGQGVGRSGDPDDLSVGVTEVVVFGHGAELELNPTYDDRESTDRALDDGAVGGLVARDVTDGVERRLRNVDPLVVDVALVVVLGHAPHGELGTAGDDVDLASATAQNCSVARDGRDGIQRGGRYLGHTAGGITEIVELGHGAEVELGSARHNPQTAVRTVEDGAVVGVIRRGRGWCGRSAA